MADRKRKITKKDLEEFIFAPSTYEEALKSIEGPDYDPYEFESDDTDEIRKQKRKIRKLRKKNNTPRLKDITDFGFWYTDIRNKLRDDFQEGKITKKDLEDKTKLVNKKLKNMKKSFKKEYGLRDKDLEPRERRIFNAYINQSNRGYVSFL